MRFTAANSPVTKVSLSDADLDKLHGTWLTVSLINDGKTIVDEKAARKDGPTTKLVYDKNVWMIKFDDKIVASGVFKIDATKTPKSIDILDASGIKNDKAKLGIYELNGDSYKYCLARWRAPTNGFFMQGGE